MQMDWLTVGAQVVNFLVLVWLLRRFLYGPITRAMQRREDRIATRLHEADEKRAEAEAEAERLRARQADLDDRREALLEEARREAAALRERLEGELRAEIEDKRRAWRRQVDEERESFLEDLGRRAAHHVHALARSALFELGDAELEQQVAARFVDRLGALDRDEAGRIAAAARSDHEGVRITSAFDMPGPVKGRLTRAVHETIADDLEVSYDRADDILLGIRLRAGSRSLEWSLSRHLARLEEAVDAKLAEGATAGAREAA